MALSFLLIQKNVLDITTSDKLYRGNSLWLADDANLVAGSKEDMQKNIGILMEAAGKYGLKLNEKKTKILQVRGTEKVDQIDGFSVEKEAKVYQQKDCCTRHPTTLVPWNFLI